MNYLSKCSQTSSSLQISTCSCVRTVFVLVYGRVPLSVSSPDHVVIGEGSLKPETELRAQWSYYDTRQEAADSKPPYVALPLISLPFVMSDVVPCLLSNY